jgi:hypothetical protein
MDERVAAAREADFGRGDPGWPQFDLARACLADAEELAAKGGAPGSRIVLYRAATALLLAAHRSRAGLETGGEPSADDDWASLAALPSVANELGELSEGQRRSVEAALGASRDVTYLLQLSEQEYRRATDALGHFAHQLHRGLGADVHRNRRALLTRWMRLGLASLFVAAGVWGIVAVLTAPPNLALHRPVVVVTPEPTHGRDPSRVVDGDRKNLGFHSINAANQTLTIDLGSVHRVSKVVVYNRADCCQERAIPLKLELSEDAKRFWQVASRTEPFNVWRARFGAVNARYVRLTDLKTDAFHLSEVEVY